ncbi:hypothetical protein BX600DRAFT_271579 [Xylariales sp. PMI_506]|nr:hypothetical protein BX600DRAFT_271579 [Xylariales sp. PMI_506]
MASTRTNGLPPNFILTPQQQALLFRALTSNQPANINTSPQTNALSLSPASASESPFQNGNGMGSLDSVQESPFLDYDYDFAGDNSFDFDIANDNSAVMIGDLPDSNDDKNGDGSSKASSPDNENGDKRSHPDEDDDETGEGSAKRRESEGKVPKKPGRKPLTNEPSSVSASTSRFESLLDYRPWFISNILTEEEGSEPCCSACFP